MEHIFTNVFYSLFKKAVKLAGVATIGSSATNSTIKGRGFTSLKRTATGEYELLLDKKYRNTYGFNVTLIRPTVADFTFQVKSETVATDGKIVFFALTGGVATSLATGDKLLIDLLFNDTDMI